MPNSANQDVMERIRLQVMWDRLLSVVEEQAQTRRERTARGRAEAVAELLLAAVLIHHRSRVGDG